MKIDSPVDDIVLFAQPKQRPVDFVLGYQAISRIAADQICEVFRDVDGSVEDDGAYSFPSDREDLRRTLHSALKAVELAFFGFGGTLQRVGRSESDTILIVEPFRGVRGEQRHVGINETLVDGRRCLRLVVRSGVAEVTGFRATTLRGLVEPSL